MCPLGEDHPGEVEGGNESSGNGSRCECGSSPGCSRSSNPTRTTIRACSSATLCILRAPTSDDARRDARTRTATNLTRTATAPGTNVACKWPCNTKRIPWSNGQWSASGGLRRWAKKMWPCQSRSEMHWSGRSRVTGPRVASLCLQLAAAAEVAEVAEAPAAAKSHRNDRGPLPRRAAGRDRERRARVRPARNSINYRPIHPDTWSPGPMGSWYLPRSGRIRRVRNVHRPARMSRSGVRADGSRVLRLHPPITDTWCLRRGPYRTTRAGSLAHVPTRHKLYQFPTQLAMVTHILRPRSHPNTDMVIRGSPIHMVTHEHPILVSCRADIIALVGRRPRPARARDRAEVAMTPLASRSTCCRTTRGKVTRLYHLPDEPRRTRPERHRAQHEALARARREASGGRAKSELNLVAVVMEYTRDNAFVRF